MPALAKRRLFSRSTISASWEGIATASRASASLAAAPAEGSPAEESSSTERVETVPGCPRGFGEGERLFALALRAASSSRTDSWIDWWKRPLRDLREVGEAIESCNEMG